MAAFFKKEKESPSSPEQLEQLLQRVEAEKKSLADMIDAAGQAAETVGEVQRIISGTEKRTDALADRLSELERIGTGVGEISQRISTLAGQLDDLQNSKAESTRLAADLVREIAEIKEVTGGIKQTLGAARQLKADFDELGGPSGAIAEMRSKAEDLHGRFLEYDHDVNAMRGDQSALKVAQEEIGRRIEEMRGTSAAFKDEVKQASEKVARLEVSVAEITRVKDMAAGMDRDLKSLKVLADQVLQKTRSVEQQREVVDRAEKQAAKLDELVWELDKRIKHVQSESKQIKKAQERLTDLQHLNAMVQDETRATQAAHNQAVEWAENALREMVAVREHISRGVDQAHADARGLDVVAQRVSDLRKQLTEFERKFVEFEKSGQLLSQARTRADEISAKMTTLTAEVDRVSEYVERVRVVQIALERTESSAARLEARMTGLEELRDRVEGISRVVTQLSGTRDDVREATERFQAIRSELDIARGQHAETKTRLSEVRTAVDDLFQKIAMVDESSVRVERVREDAERAMGAMREFESREEFLVQLETRLARLGTIGEELTERMKQLDQHRTEIDAIDARMGALGARLDDADNRFEAVNRKSDDIVRADERISTVVDRAKEADRMMGELGAGIEAALARDEELTRIAGRVESMADEFARREKALQQATDHLERASVLRQNAADTAARLEEQGRLLAASLASGEEQASRVADLAERIETRAESLRFAEKRFTQFEEKLASLKRAEDEIVGHIEGILLRQQSVEAVRDELARAFGTAEKTMQDVRLITEARHEIATARASMEEVLVQAHQVNDTAATIERRKEEIEEAEQKLTRLDALLSEVRTSLGTLRSQQAVLEHLIERGGQLTFQAKEAEALIDALREERELASRVRQALSDVRDDDSQSLAG